MKSMPAVIIQFLPNGDINYHMNGKVDLLIIDETCPEDRVFRWTEQTSQEEIDELIGDSPIRALKMSDIVSEVELECLANIADAMCDYLIDEPYSENISNEVNFAMNYLDEICYGRE